MCGRGCGERHVTSRYTAWMHKEMRRNEGKATRGQKIMRMKGGGDEETEEKKVDKALDGWRGGCRVSKRKAMRPKWEEVRG